MYPLPCLFACDRPYPEPEGKDGRSGQPPVGTINVVAEQPSQPVARHNAIADTGPPHATTGTMTARSAPDTSRLWLPHTNGIHVSTPSPKEATSNQLAYHTSTRRPSAPGTQRLVATSSPHSHTLPPRAAPTPPRLGSENSPTVASAQGLQKLFRWPQAPLGKPRRIRISLLPLALSLSRRHRPPHKAHQGGGPQHE